MAVVRHRVFLALAAALSCASLATAQYSFTDLGYLRGHWVANAMGVSGDGRVAVGFSMGNGDMAPIRWTKEYGMQDFGGTGLGAAVAASGTGDVIVGKTSDYARAFRWTKQTGMVDIGPFSATGVSSDGSVVVGFMADRAIRWTEADGIVEFPTPPGVTAAWGVSADGSTAVGWWFLDDNQNALAVRWTPSTGMEVLGKLPGQVGGTDALGASADGSVVVGISGSHAFRWTQQTGMIDLGDGIAYATSADGSVVVGSPYWGPDGFYWSEKTGRLDLGAWLSSHGIDLSDWPYGLGAMAISADGGTIAGAGYYAKSGYEHAWVATVPPICVADCDGSGTLDADDFGCYSACFAAGSILADCDNSGSLDVDDFICFQTKFAQGCP